MMRIFKYQFKCVGIRGKNNKRLLCAIMGVAVLTLANPWNIFGPATDNPGEKDITLESGDVRVNAPPDTHTGNEILTFTASVPTAGSIPGDTPDGTVANDPDHMNEPQVTIIPIPDDQSGDNGEAFPPPGRSKPAENGQAEPPAGKPHGKVQGQATAEGITPTPAGVKFVEAAITPLTYELNQRFWGWRPNDIISIGDNVENYQLGVLEVTRRTVVALTERLSRTGSTDAFDTNLQNAMNWFMVKADRYWFPSPEGKFADGLAEMEAYVTRLRKHEASFYTRPDNLIPLLTAYEDLLGSCDENLVKWREKDGKKVSFFSADDYLYYAQGVVSAMVVILEAAIEDFAVTLETRNGYEILHHAIESCHRAREINPWIITESNLSGFLANHRANIAAPISHARFYIGILIKTLST